MGNTSFLNNTGRFIQNRQSNTQETAPAGHEVNIPQIFKMEFYWRFTGIFASDGFFIIFCHNTTNYKAV